jgi:hypothetical protein
MLPGTSFQKSALYVETSKNFILNFFHKRALKIERTISAHREIHIYLILRPAKKYSSHDTIPMKYYCELTLRSRGSSRSSETSARSLQQRKVLENPNHMRILKRRHS